MCEVAFGLGRIVLGIAAFISTRFVRISTSILDPRRLCVGALFGIWLAVVAQELKEVYHDWSIPQPQIVKVPVTKTAE